MSLRIRVRGSSSNARVNDPGPAWCQSGVSGVAWTGQLTWEHLHDDLVFGPGRDERVREESGRLGLADREAVASVDVQGEEVFPCVRRRQRR
jgi:hypothetical protein